MTQLSSGGRFCSGSDRSRRRSFRQTSQRWPRRKMPRIRARAHRRRRRWHCPSRLRRPHILLVATPRRRARCRGTRPPFVRSIRPCSRRPQPLRPRHRFVRTPASPASTATSHSTAAPSVMLSRRATRRRTSGPRCSNRRCRPSRPNRPTSVRASSHGPHRPARPVARLRHR